MSTFSVSNDELDVGYINFQCPRVSTQASYANITVTGTPQVLPLDTVFVFCAASSGGTINLVLPPPIAGKNLFIVNRNTTATAVNSQNSSGGAVSIIVDIENDPNVLSPTTQATILSSAVGGTWVHLVGNGKHWVAVAKPLLAPA